MDDQDDSARSIPIESFRPTLRPPIANLTIFDDGEKDGEIVRLRREEYFIGRSQGDIQIAHDSLISDPHLSLRRDRTDNGYLWIVSDLESRTGLWMRVRRIELREETEFLLGRGCYRFRTAVADPSEIDNSLEACVNRGSLFGQTMDTNLDGFTCAYPTLESIDRDNGPGTKAAKKLILVDNEYWIGRDVSCGLRASSDTFLMPRHCRIFSEGGKWFAESMPGPNGMWIRRLRIIVDSSSTFQIGEQRFRLVCSQK
ncbi:MAG: FHA domain-containing protein [Pirellulaceae bacterium]|nr:FHA domain-containing protein [Pirellulaceae bacterium]